MENNKFEVYQIQTVQRSSIHEAPYNPRKISNEARKKLKKGLKTYGLVQPIVVNRKTMNDDENDTLFDTKPEQEDIVDMVEEAKKADRLKAARQAERDMRKADNRSDNDYQAKYDDYTLTLVFENNAAKQDFCKRAHIEAKEKFVKSSILYDVADGKINMRGQP